MAGKVKVPSAKISAKGGSALKNKKAPQKTTGTIQDLSNSPIKLGFHMLFYLAGRIADKIVSLYTRTFALEGEYLADLNKSTAMTHARDGHWEKAIPLLERALSINPRDQESRMHLVEAYGATDQHEKAHQHLAKIPKTSPNSARTMRALGALHVQRMSYARAIEYLQKALELEPGHVQSHYHLGQAYDNEKLYEQAVESFQQAIRLDPRFAKAYQALGFTYESMGDRASAVEYFKKALELE